MDEWVIYNFFKEKKYPAKCGRKKKQANQSFPIITDNKATHKNWVSGWTISEKNEKQLFPHFFGKKIIIYWVSDH